MTTGFFDVVVMGTELGPLAAGALLAKRGLRVLVVGQGAPFDMYSCFGYQFSRRPFLITSSESLAMRRVINELGLNQLYQRLIDAPKPMYQVVLPTARVDVNQDHNLLKSEMEREFPGSSASSDEIFHHLGRMSGEIDKLLANDMVVPPESFIEKRELARAEVQNPFRSLRDADPFAGIPCEPGFKEMIEAPARFETAGAKAVPPLPLFRQISGWLFGCHSFKGGRDGMRKLFSDYIASQGGELHLQKKVAEIALSRGKVAEVGMSGREGAVKCQIVLTDLSPKELAPLVAPSAWPKRFRELVEQSPLESTGYAVNLGIAAEAVPQGLARIAVVSSGGDVGDKLLRIERIPQKDETKAALQIACAVPPGSERTVQTGALRDAILDRIRWLVPFLDDHLEVIHSPFDRFGPIDLKGDAKGDAPPVPHAEEIPKWPIRPPAPNAVLGIGNLPNRTGIKGLLLSGSQVICGLGVEGEMIAAWGAARIACRTDSRREQLARSMKSKMEI